MGHPVLISLPFAATQRDVVLPEITRHPNDTTTLEGEPASDFCDNPTYRIPEIDLFSPISGDILSPGGRLPRAQGQLLQGRQEAEAQ